MSTLSTDLRQRIIDSSEAGEGGSRPLAERFRVSRSSVVRLRKRYKETGEVLPKPRGGGRRSSLLPAHEETLRFLTSPPKEPTLEELKHLLATEYQVSTSTSSIDRALKKLKITLKKSHSMPQKETQSKSTRNEQPSISKSNTSKKSKV